MFPRAVCCRKRMEGVGAAASISTRSKQGASWQICGETLRMPWDLDVLRGAGRADRHHSGVAA
jgi:hypothetical protein